MDHQPRSALRWLWLLVPVAIASVPWATVPLVNSQPDGSSSEGALFVAALAGLASTAFTVAIAIVVLCVIQQQYRLSRVAYVGLILAVGLPQLAFQAYFLSASIMTGLVGTWALYSNDQNLKHVCYGASFALMYALIGIVTYPFTREGDFSRAAPAAAVVILAAFAFVLLIAL